MATLTIRRLDDEAYERLRSRAKANRRSLEAEARHILEERARDLDDVVADLRVFQEKMVARHGVLPDSLPIIREDRDDG